MFLMRIWSDWKRGREKGWSAVTERRLESNPELLLFLIKDTVFEIRLLPPAPDQKSGEEKKNFHQHTLHNLTHYPPHLPIHLLYPHIHHRRSVNAHTHTPGPSYPATPPPTPPLSSPNVLTTLSPADSISVSCRRKCLPPLLPYHRNNAAECSDTAALSAAQYTKADTMPHIGAQTRNTAHSAPVNQTTCTMLPHRDVLMIVSYMGFYLCVYCL